MRLLLVFLLLCACIPAVAFEKGRYQCVQGNEQSICPQRISLKKEYGIHRLYVIYSGYCNDQGPFIYECQDMENCGDGAVIFKKLSNISYQWENSPHGFYCRFEKEP